MLYKVIKNDDSVSVLCLQLVFLTLIVQGPAELSWTASFAIMAKFMICNQGGLFLDNPVYSQVEGAARDLKGQAKGAFKDAKGDAKGAFRNAMFGLRCYSASLSA